MPPGCGSITVVRSGQRSRVTRAFATSPLRLLTPANHGPAAWVFTSTYGGGLVDGDHIAIEIDVGPGAAAYVSTQASSKIYKSSRGSAADLTGRIAEGGCLIAAPDPVVCFAGARYRQRQRFDVDAGGSLVVTDCILSGRRASGEEWAFSEYRSLLEVTVDGRMILHDPLALRAADGALSDRLGRFHALAVAVIVGPRFHDAAASLLAASASWEVERNPDVIMSAAPLRSGGCILRAGGNSAEGVTGRIREALRFVPVALEDDPWMRKW